MGAGGVDDFLAHRFTLWMANVLSESEMFGKLIYGWTSCQHMALGDGRLMFAVPFCCGIHVTGYYLHVFDTLHDCVDRSCICR